MQVQIVSNKPIIESVNYHNLGNIIKCWADDVVIFGAFVVIGMYIINVDDIIDMSVIK